VDGAAGNVVDAWRTIREELEAYGGGLSEKPEILVLNKCDAMSPRETSARRAALAKASGKQVYVASGVSREGVPEILRVLMTIVHEARTARAAAYTTTVPA
jgi:GTP-binding protein